METVLELQSLTPAVVEEKFFGLSSSFTMGCLAPGTRASPCFSGRQARAGVKDLVLEEQVCVVKWEDTERKGRLKVRNPLTIMLMRRRKEMERSREKHLVNIKS